MQEELLNMPPAKSLIFGIRSIGYHFVTAVADIIDNSVSAYATEIDIYSNPEENNAYFCFLDNGCGMNQEELRNAMKMGSDREGKVDSQQELGRFGLGLKSASFSQCKKLTVVSKQNDEINGLIFDLNLIGEKNQWLLLKLDKEMISTLPLIEKLESLPAGTLVIWQEFDKIEQLSKQFEKSFRALVAESKKHVEFVFHRFSSRIQFRFNEQVIERRDPFLTDSLGRQQTGRRTELKVDGEKITITPYTLPFANTLTLEEKKLLGNPKSIYDEQGFYLYRNQRLISWGSWLRMGIKSELNKLARVKVDIPSSLDAMWMLDVKKSSAKIPDKLKDQIRASVEDSVIRSKRTVKSPGIKEQTVDHKIWERLHHSSGEVQYQINRENPIYTSWLDAIGEQEKILLAILLSQLECHLPKFSIQNDVSDGISILNSGDDVEQETLMGQVETLLHMLPEESRESSLLDLLAMESFQKISHRKNELLSHC